MTSNPVESIPQGSWPRRIGSVAVLVAVFGAGVWFVGAIEQAREAARHTQCRSNLGQLYFALRHYHEVYGAFPPAYIADADGKPLHSWRVLILPYIDGVALYEQYRFDEPWNGPNNRKLADQTGDRFHCASGPNWQGSPLTDYVVIAGPQTAFPGAESRSLDDITDGPENTILLAEIANSDIHWMEPRDMRIDEMSFVVDDRDQASIASPHPLGPAVVFADRLTAYRLDASLRPETLRAMMTIAGGEGVSKEDLILPSDGHGWRLGE